MTWPIVGLLTTFREGRLLEDAARSLIPACDRILCLEGRIDGVDEGQGDPSWLSAKTEARVLWRKSGDLYASDAALRTELLRWAQQRVRGPFWTVVLAADEILLWGEYLPAYLQRAGLGDELGAMKIKICEAGDDFSQVQETGSRLLPGHLIDEYVLSSFHIRIKGHATVLTLPNGPALRPPLQGEPHILHRSYLRPPSRNQPAQRLSEAERRELVELGFEHLKFPKPLEASLRKGVMPSYGSRS